MRSRGDRLEAGAFEGADGGGARVELLDLLLGAHAAAGGRGAFGGGDDEVALEHGDIDLERADDAADVGAATGALDEVVHAAVEPRDLLRGLVALGSGRDERDLVAGALDPCAHQGDSLGRLGRPGREGGACLQGARQRVEQSARLGQADGERAARRQRQVLGGVGVEATVDEGREPFGLDGPDPAAVERRLEQGQAVADGLPERQRHGQVVGDGDLLGLGQLEDGTVDLAEVGSALGHPLAQGDSGRSGPRRAWTGTPRRPGAVGATVPGSGWLCGTAVIVRTPGSGEPGRARAALRASGCRSPSTARRPRGRR